jgi:hypothetical protein
MSKPFTISDQVLDKCTDFAQASAASSAKKYASRNQFNLTKITNDIRNGKIAEECVYFALKEQFPTLSPPDHEIYHGKAKSWAPDLSANGETPFVLAVKSQEAAAAAKYGKSWVFQFRQGSSYDVDKGIFGDQKDDSHHVAFVSVNLSHRTGLIEAVVKVSWLLEHKMFKEMKVHQLKNNKVAVYHEDLIKFPPEELWQI